MRALLDTGPWVALLDRSESMHSTCLEWFKTFTGSLFSTEAVLTEVMYLLNFSVKAQTAALDFVLHAAVQLMPSDSDSLAVCRQFMEKYSDLPMDYADATLVCLAEETDITDIVTLDRKDFGIYRTGNQATFNIIP